MAPFSLWLAAAIFSRNFFGSRVGGGECVPGSRFRSGLPERRKSEGTVLLPIIPFLAACRVTLNLAESIYGAAVFLMTVVSLESLAFLPSILSSSSMPLATSFFLASSSSSSFSMGLLLPALGLSFLRLATS